MITAILYNLSMIIVDAGTLVVLRRNPTVMVGMKVCFRGLLVGAILAIVLSQIVAVAGYGEYFPWSIPALYSQGDDLGAISFVIVGVTGITGVVATFFWWERADQVH